MELLTGNPRKLFIKYLIPSVSAGVSVAVYSLIDTIAIGQGVGPVGAAACAVVLPVFSIAEFIAFLCGTGGSVLMNKARGEGNRNRGDVCFTAAVVYMAIAVLIAWISGVLLQTPFYRLCGADEEILPFAYEYGRWIFAAFPSFVLVPFLGFFIRTDGSPRFVMSVSLIGGIVNSIGDYLFVFPMHLGMTGAAAATVIGSVIQTLLLLSYIAGKKTSLKFARSFKWGSVFREIGAITRIGFGSGFTAISVIVMAFLANNQIMRYCGAASLAVYGMISTVMTLFLCVFYGVGQAAQPIVSANYGAGQLDRCRLIGRMGLVVSAAFGILFSGLFLAFPSQLTALFMKTTPKVRAAAPYITRVYGLSFFFLAVNIFATAWLQAVTRAKAAAVFSLLRGIILSGLLIWLLPLFIGGNGIWWSFAVAEGITAAAAMCYMGRIVFSSKSGNNWTKALSTGRRGFL